MSDNPVGRPPKFESPEEMKNMIEKYFKKCETTGEPKTILGLCNFLDIHRSTLGEYEDKEGFSNTVKKAKSICEQHVNEKALKGEYNATMAIFNLKNNFGWEDRKKQEIEGESVINVNLEED